MEAHSSTFSHHITFAGCRTYKIDSDQDPCNRILMVLKYYLVLTVGAQSTVYSAFVSKLSKLSGEYLCPQKTQKAAFFFYTKDLRLESELKF
jgi:hypothetical protein